jgi:4-amino-4-deoxy-L-arabinose transferase-like glycosyltransferase
VDEVSAEMLSVLTKPKLASVLRSPALAVVAAYALRMVLLWLAHHNEDPVNPRFETVGLENNLVAMSLAMSKGFFGPYPGYEAVTAVLAPVYPWMSAIGYKLFHLDYFGGMLFCQTMNSAFSAATCWPIHAVGKKVFGERVGLASAWLWVFLPYAVLFPLEWTWDQSLAAFMLASIVCATLNLRQSTSALHWSGYGLLWGFTALVNPTVCILLPFLLVWLMIRQGQAARPSTGLVMRTVFMFLLVLLPWTIRNYYAVDGLVFVKSNFGLELWLGNNPAVKENYSRDLHPLRNYAERLQLIMSGEPNYNREKQREAIAFIKAHPRTFLKNSFDRFVDNWAGTYDSHVDPWIHTLHLSRADVWFSSAFSVISFVGMILALRANLRDSLPLALCLLLFPIPYYLTHTELRYRHPIDPLMTLFTVYAIVRLCSALGGRVALDRSEGAIREQNSQAAGAVGRGTDRLARSPLQR